MSTEKQTARLENWYIDYNDRLVGLVYGHPLMPDGETVSTSRVVTMSGDKTTATTKNTIYILGKPRENEVQL